MRQEWRLAVWVAVGVGLVGLVAATSAPLGHLGGGQGATASGVHGLLGSALLLSSTVLTYLGFRLYTGKLSAWAHTRWIAMAVAVLSAATVLWGNWTYVFYRAAEGPRDFFLGNQPEMHTVLFEFKRMLALACVPLSTAVAYVFTRFRAVLPENRDLAQAAGVLAGLTWACAVVAFALGALVTKARGL